MALPIIIDGSFLEGGGQILRLSVTYSAILGIPVRVINIRANRPKPGLAQQHLHGIKLVSDLCNGQLKGAHIGSTEIELWPKEIKGGNFEVHLTTAGSIGLMLQCALPVALFGNHDVFFSLGGGTDCQFAPLIDYTMDVLGYYLKKFGIDTKFNLEKRGLFPKGGGKVKVNVKKIDSVLNPIIIEDPGECSRIFVNVIHTGPNSGEDSKDIAKYTEDKIKTSISLNVDVNTVVTKETRIIPGCADTALLTVGYETDSGVKCCSTRILDYPRAKKRSHECYDGAVSRVSLDKAKKTVDEIVQEIIAYIKKQICCDNHMQDQLIVYMALAQGTSKIVVDQITDHTKTTQYVTNLMTKAQVKFIPLDGDRHVIECIGVGVKNSNVN